MDEKLREFFKEQRRLGEIAKEARINADEAANVLANHTSRLVGSAEKIMLLDGVRAYSD